MNEIRDQSLGERRSNGTEPSPTKRGATKEKVIARCGRALATRMEGHEMYGGLRGLVHCAHWAIFKRLSLGGYGNLTCIKKYMDR